MVNLSLPPDLLDTVQVDTWVRPVPADRVLEHVLDWLNAPANHNQATVLLGPLLTRHRAQPFRDATGAKSG